MAWSKVLGLPFAINSSRSFARGIVGFLRDAVAQHAVCWTGHHRVPWVNGRNNNLLGRRWAKAVATSSFLFAKPCNPSFIGIQLAGKTIRDILQTVDISTFR
jgi:hypothetical protein